MKNLSLILLIFSIFCTKLNAQDCTKIKKYISQYQKSKTNENLKKIDEEISLQLFKIASTKGFFSAADVNYIKTNLKTIKIPFKKIKVDLFILNDLVHKKKITTCISFIDKNLSKVNFSKMQFNLLVNITYSLTRIMECTDKNQCTKMISLLKKMNKLSNNYFKQVQQNYEGRLMFFELEK